MAGYHDQARAIWTALDTMLQQDPDGYKRFISEQMEEGRKMVKKQQNASSPAKNKQDNSLDTLNKAFEKMSLGSDNDGKVEMLQRDMMTSACSSSKKKTGKGVKTVPKQGKNVEGNNNESNANSSRLLDDEIGGGKSILEQIVKNADRKAYESDEDDVKLATLEVNSVAGGSKGSCPPQKMKKPLIEEI